MTYRKGTAMTAQKIDHITKYLQPEPSFMPVTPEYAKSLLEANVSNRRVRQAQVNKYAADMAAGRWTFSNDAICVGAEGSLYNGQHRLHAVVKSGVTVVMLVITDMTAESMPTMDSGAARTASDALGFLGEGNTNLLASACKQAVLITDGRIYKDNVVQGVSHSEIIEFLDSNPSIRRSVEVALRVNGQIDATPTGLAVAHWMIAQVNGTAKATEFMYLIATPVGQVSGSPIFALNSRLREIRRGRASLPARNYLFLILKTWNRYAKGTKITTLVAAPRTGQWRRPPVERA